MPNCWGGVGSYELCKDCVFEKPEVVAFLKARKISKG